MILCRLSISARLRLRTFENERPLPIKIDIIACSVIDPPGVIDPVYLRSPDVAASRSCRIAPDDFGLAGLEASDGFGACDADVRPGRGQKVVVAVAGVDDEGV